MLWRVLTVIIALYIAVAVLTQFALIEFKRQEYSDHDKTEVQMYQDRQYLGNVRGLEFTIIYATILMNTLAVSSFAVFVICMAVHGRHGHYLPFFITLCLWTGFVNSLCHLVLYIRFRNICDDDGMLCSRVANKYLNNTQAEEKAIGDKNACLTKCKEMDDTLIHLIINLVVCSVGPILAMIPLILQWFIVKKSSRKISAQPDDQ